MFFAWLNVMTDNVNCIMESPVPFFLSVLLLLERTTPLLAAVSHKTRFSPLKMCFSTLNGLVLYSSHLEQIRRKAMWSLPPKDQLQNRHRQLFRVSMKTQSFAWNWDVAVVWRPSQISHESHQPKDWTFFKSYTYITTFPLEGATYSFKHFWFVSKRVFVWMCVCSLINTALFSDN